MPLAGAQAPGRVLTRRYRDPLRMTREEVLELIRSHLADELELDPERVQLGTRFREDLAIDSLDLYTMVQELEDTYGISVPDEQAIKLVTVNDTVEYVLSQAGGH
jgi:acyl carrier protein